MASTVALTVGACQSPAVVPPSTVPVDTLLQASRWRVIGGIEPANYAARLADGAVQIDGLLSETEWRSAPWSAPFGDISGMDSLAPGLLTRVKIMWDASFLYIGAEMEEPHLWGTLRDSTKAVWNENDFEIFIEPDGDTHDYLEIEINAVNTRNQVHFPRAYGDAGRSDRRAWMDGFRSAVQLRGSLNDARDIDSGWSLEAAFPWSGFVRYGTDGGPPAAGTTWRMNFGRVQWPVVPDSVGIGYMKTQRRGEGFSTWTPQGVFQMHVPEMFGFVQFRGDEAAADRPSLFRRMARSCLLDAYYRARVFRDRTGTFAASLGQLYGVEGPADPCQEMAFDKREKGFVLTLRDEGGGQSASIDHRRHLSFPATDVLSIDLRPD
jgi:Carbohydrate family 9 binding domain-like